MGLGRFGGGVGVTRWLAAQGAKVLVTDLAPATKLEKSLGEIADLIESGAVSLRLGEHREEDFTDTDVVIANPAVPKPWENRYLNVATEAGVPITTEIRLLVERLPTDDVIGVTGTAGKSTTVAMMRHILIECAHRGHVGGNIGGSLLGELDVMRCGDIVVLELSSAQLYWLGEGIGFTEAPGWSPDTAVVTSISPNHLDWHGSYAHYIRSKQAIMKKDLDFRLIVWDQATGDLMGKPIEHWRWKPTRCEELQWPRRSRIRAGENIEFGKVSFQDLFEVNLQLPGVHNYRNAILAVRALSDCGVMPEGALEALDSFGGLPHRLEAVRLRGGVQAFNDSKSTTPEAIALAIAAFEEPNECGADHIHLICGGYDKQIDLSPMIKPAARCKAVYTIGATGPAIARETRAAGGNAHDSAELHAAVREAIDAASPGDVILLSPGCASWDQFENYEQRGDQFKALVQDALGTAEPKEPG